jgi:hypothetical protein
MEDPIGAIDRYLVRLRVDFLPEAERRLGGPHSS